MMELHPKVQDLVSKYYSGSGGNVSMKHIPTKENIVDDKLADQSNQEHLGEEDNNSGLSSSGAKVFTIDDILL